MAWFDALCDTHSAFALVTGHHADDQAETWMLHAMRSPDPGLSRACRCVKAA